MQAVKWIGFWVLACLPCMTMADDAAVADAKALRELCSGEGSQAEMKACLSKQAEESAAALKAAEARAVGAIGAWDEDKPHVDRARSALAVSSKAFASYRAAQCGLASSLGGGAAGNTRESLRLACVAELNGRRTRQLVDEVETLPQK